MTTTRVPGLLGKARVRAAAVFAVASLAVTAVAVTATSGGAAEEESQAVEIFSSIPQAGVTQEPSWSYNSQSTSELGLAVEFAQDARNLDEITISLSSWACESGTPSGGDCETTEGSSYQFPVTVNVYEIDESGEQPAVGETIATLTRDVDIQYRPSSTPDQCDGTSKWYSEELDYCFNGYAFPATFDFSEQDVELPDRAFVTVAFESSARSDIGAGPWNVLNLGLADTVPYGAYPVPAGNAGVVTGERLYEDAVVINTTIGSHYGDGGAGGTGVLRHAVTDWWQDFVPVFSVTATSPVTPEPTPTPQQPEPGETVTETVALGDTVVSFTAELGDHPSGELVLSSSYSDNPAEFGELPGDAHFGFGAYSFELNVAVGSTATVTLVTETPANTLFKSIDNEWSKYPAEFDGTAITFELVDGGAGDADGEANGIIVDPVAPAVMATFTG